MEQNTKKIKFGTGGWRAVIGSDFIEENIRKVSQGVANMLIQDGQTDKPVIIGFDRRFLSDSAAKWIAEVLCANGIHVWFLKRSAPTPLIMHTVKKNDLYCGMEVTASHNPPAYNGIKLIVREGRDASVEITSRLEDIIAAEEEVKKMPFDEAVENGLLTFVKNPFNNFIDDIINMLDMDAIRERGLRIAFDPMHGSGTYPLMVILCTARCTLDIINQNKDAYFGTGTGMPAPTEKGLGELAYKVKMQGYDLGIAFDGDGDRVGIIDGDGRYVSANEILAMLYWYLHEYKGWKGPVVRNLSTTHLLDRIARDFGEICYEVPVGFKYVSSKIDETDAVLGGESSGGLTVRGHIFGKDSIYAASLFVEMLSVTGMTTREILDKLHAKYGTTEFREFVLAFDGADKAQIMDMIMEQKKLPDFIWPVEKVSYLDGVKVYFKDDSFVTCRFSGTEPVLRIMSEASTAELADAYIEAFRRFVEERNA